MLQGWAANKFAGTCTTHLPSSASSHDLPTCKCRQMSTGQRHLCKLAMLFRVSKRCTPPALPVQSIPEPANIPVQTAPGLHANCCSTMAWPTPCRRKLEEWSDGDSRELHLEVSPGEERTLEALVRFCYTKQIPFNRGGLLHREAWGGCCTEMHGEAAAQGGGLHREVGCPGRWAAQKGCCIGRWASQEHCCTGTLLHSKVGCTGRWAPHGRCCTGRWAAQGHCCTGRLLHKEVGPTGAVLHRQVGCTGTLLHREAAAQDKGQHREPLGAQQGPEQDPVPGSWRAACLAKPQQSRCADLGWALAAQRLSNAAAQAQADPG